MALTVVMPIPTTKSMSSLPVESCDSPLHPQSWPVSTQQMRKGGQKPLQPVKIHNGEAFRPLQVLVSLGLCLQTRLSPGLNFKPLRTQVSFPIFMWEVPRAMLYRCYIYSGWP